MYLCIIVKASAAAAETAAMRHQGRQHDINIKDIIDVRQQGQKSRVPDITPKITGKYWLYTLKWSSLSQFIIW